MALTWNIGLVTKRDKRNTTISKKFDDNLILASCDFILIFSIYDKFGAIRKLDSRCIVCNSYILINDNFSFVYGYVPNFKFLG